MGTGKILKILKKNSGIYRQIIILGVIVFLYITFCIYAYDEYVKENVINIYSVEANQVIGEISNNDTIVQKFIYGNKQIDGIGIRTATYGEKTAGSGTLVVELIDGNTREILATTEGNMSEIKDNSYVDFYFDEPVYVEGKNEFEIRLTTRGMRKNDKFTLWLASTDTPLSYNGKNQEFGIILHVNTTETDFFTKMCLFAAITVGLVIVVSYILIFMFKYKGIHNYFIIYAVLIGGLYFVFVPEYETPDEQRHIQTAYSLSNAIMGYDEEDEIIMRQSDFEGKYFFTKYTRNDYNEYVRQLIEPDEPDENMVSIGKSPLNAKKYLYIFSALGITLGRALHLGTVQTYLIGSIFNYIMFVLAAYFSIKRIPICKTALMLISILPMTLQQVTSYSYDCAIITLAMVMISYSLKIAYDEEVSKVDTVILIVSTILFAPVKSGAYILMCGIVLLPIVKLWKKNKIISRVLLAGLVISMVAFVLPMFIGESSQTSDTLTSGYVEWADEEGYTISSLIGDPWHCVVIFWETIMTKLSFYLQTLIGGSLGWFQISVQWFVVVALIMAISVSSVKKKNEIIQMSMKTRSMLAVICLLTTAFIIGALLLDWTPISYNSVEGVQGRYFLPFFILLLLIFRGDWIKADERADGYCMYLSILMQPFIFFALINSF